MLLKKSRNGLTLCIIFHVATSFCSTLSITDLIYFFFSSWHHRYNSRTVWELFCNNTYITWVFHSIVCSGHVHPFPRPVTKFTCCTTLTRLTRFRKKKLKKKERKAKKELNHKTRVDMLIDLLEHRYRSHKLGWTVMMREIKSKIKIKFKYAFL